MTWCFEYLQNQYCHLFFLWTIIHLQWCHLLTSETFVSTLLLQWLHCLPEPFAVSPFVLNWSHSEHRKPWYLRMCPVTELRSSVAGKLALSGHRWRSGLSVYTANPFSSCSKCFAVVFIGGLLQSGWLLHSTASQCQTNGEELLIWQDIQALIWQLFWFEVPLKW